MRSGLKGGVMDERDSIQPAALGIMCKAPQPGTTKTRLAAVVGSEQAASLAACFLRDVATVVEAVPEGIGRRCYGVYAPKTAEEVLKTILPASFGLVLQEDADFGVVLSSAVRHLLEAGHGWVVLINADSPTLPAQLLTEANPRPHDGWDLAGDRASGAPCSVCRPMTRASTSRSRFLCLPRSLCRRGFAESARRPQCCPTSTGCYLSFCSCCRQIIPGIVSWPCPSWRS